jgi:hypothetical protein
MTLKETLALITPWDKDYKATKKIKRGEKSLKPPFTELAKWIAEKWDVSVLNVIYDRIRVYEPPIPRLQIVLEHERDSDKFHRSRFVMDARKQKAVASRFKRIIANNPKHTFNVDGLFVVFNAFAPLAIWDACEHVPEEQIESLKKKLRNKDLWCIARQFASVTFMFHTDKQTAKHAGAGKKEIYAKAYFDLVKPYDEFGYLSMDDIQVQFDSKQNFDENYAGSWVYYYR